MLHTMIREVGQFSLQQQCNKTAVKRNIERFPLDQCHIFLRLGKAEMMC